MPPTDASVTRKIPNWFTPTNPRIRVLRSLTERPDNLGNRSKIALVQSGRETHPA